MRAFNTARKDPRGHYRVAQLDVVSPLLHLCNYTADRIATSRAHASGGLVSALEKNCKPKRIYSVYFLIVFHP